MPMTPFVTRFPELGARETRALRVTGRKEQLERNIGKQHRVNSVYKRFSHPR